MEEKKNFRTGACALREGGSHKGRRVFIHLEAPSQEGQRGAAESQAKWGPRQQNTEEVAFLSP